VPVIDPVDTFCAMAQFDAVKAVPRTARVRASFLKSIQGPIIFGSPEFFKAVEVQSASGPPAGKDGNRYADEDRYPGTRQGALRVLELNGANFRTKACLAQLQVFQG